MIGRLQRFVPERIGLGLSVLLFGLPALVLWIVTSALVPHLVTRGWQPLAAWFAAGMLFLGPLLAAALAGAWIARPVPTVAGTLEHLRVRRMTAGDWRVAAFTLVITLAAMAVLQAFNSRSGPNCRPTRHS